MGSDEQTVKPLTVPVNLLVGSDGTVTSLLQSQLQVNSFRLRAAMSDAYFGRHHWEAVR